MCLILFFCPILSLLSCFLLLAQVIQDRVKSRTQKAYFSVIETSRFTHLLILILSWLTLFMWITYHIDKDSVYVKSARYNLKISQNLLLVITDLERTLYIGMFMIHLHTKSTCYSGSLLTAIRCKAKENVCTTIMLLFCIPQHYLKIYYIIIVSYITTHRIKTLM